MTDALSTKPLRLSAKGPGIELAAAQKINGAFNFQYFTTAIGSL
jgi:hypothetical protein